MKAKPFVKWVGGKGQLLEQLEAMLPAGFDEWENVTYIEPFVGGGAMLFYMLQTHPNISRAVINDINPDLMTCYKMVRDNPNTLILSLKEIQDEYYFLTNEEERKAFYILRREEFNKKEHGDIRNATLFFFLNRTCFNGLYRVNKSGFFNVPFGRYKKPMICDSATIYADSELLQRVEIMTGDYQQTIDKACGNTLFYFDSPFRPLNATSNFNNYAKEAFNDLEQLRLKEFCDIVQNAGYKFMLSNSDCSSANPKDLFFEDLYSEYQIERVLASRNVNSNASKRGKLTELLIRNYNNKNNLFNMQKQIIINIDETTKNPELILTAEQMASSDYKERFIAEYIQVKNRLERLEKMIKDWEADTLSFTPTCPKEIYDFQIRAMKDYLRTLIIRAKIENIDL